MYSPQVILGTCLKKNHFYTKIYSECAMVFARGKKCKVQNWLAKKETREKIVIKYRCIVLKKPIIQSQQKRKKKKKWKGAEKLRKTRPKSSKRPNCQILMVFSPFLGPLALFFHFFFSVDLVILNTINLHFMTIFFSCFLLGQSILNHTFLPSRKNHGTFRISFCIEVVCFCDKHQKFLFLHRLTIYWVKEQ